ncbi:MAG: CopG family transcriptional regulator [Chloroflexi bacterium RBG_16_48_8]|nr:MAG: CopG family transcriptional regulator [Chloroflexi bacterium RBG_16_48_8]
MYRTQVQLTESQIQALKDMASAQKKSMAELIRQAVDILLRSSGEVDREERKRRAIAAAGRFHSGLGDLSTDHDKHLSEAYQHDDLR